MTKKQLLVSAVLLAAAAQFSTSAAGLAQQTQAPAPGAATSTQAGAARSQTGAPAPGGQEASNAPAAGDQAVGPPEITPIRRSPVFVITGVEVFQSSLRPPIDVVRVTGLAPSSGWSEPELIALGTGTPSDGMLDLLLTASAPSENADASGFAPMEAILPIDPGHPFKGVRVRSATNALTLRQIPGHVEGRAPTEDCSACVGKLFVAKGQSAPAGATDVVKQENLPSDTLIIKPTDGVGQTIPDPNRLTVILGDDSRIIGAFWN